MIKLSEISKGDRLRIIHTIEDFGRYGDIVTVTKVFKHAAIFKNPKNGQNLTCHASFFSFLEGGVEVENIDMVKVRQFCNNHGIKMDEDLASRFVFSKDKNRRVFGETDMDRFGTTEKVIEMLKKEFC